MLLCHLVFYFLESILQLSHLGVLLFLGWRVVYLPGQELRQFAALAQAISIKKFSRYGFRRGAKFLLFLLQLLLPFLLHFVLDVHGEVNNRLPFGFCPAEAHAVVDGRDAEVDIGIQVIVILVSLEQLDLVLVQFLALLVDVA